MAQLSVSRLDQLEQQCLSWSGAPLSAAVYLPLLSDPNIKHTGKTKSGFQRGGNNSESTSKRRELFLKTHEKPVIDANEKRMSTSSWYSASGHTYHTSGQTLKLPERLRDMVSSAVSRMELLVSRCVIINTPAEKSPPLCN